MNERIKELAQEAGFKVDWQHQDVQAIKMARFEKLAKLIIQECAQVCNDVDAEYDGEDVLATWCAQAINKHFGIGD